MRRDQRADVVLVRGDVVLARFPLWVEGALDLSVVDRLARWQLAARRRGCSLRLQRPCPELVELLDLVGLTGVVPGLPLREVGGEAEGGEQPGVEEVVVADDPVA